MIDTDEYEGHQPAPWKWFGAYLLGRADDYGLPLFRLNGEPTELGRPDEKLIEDAPLLLAEVKRLREEKELMVTYLRYMRDGELTDKDWLTVNDWIGQEEEE
tara:strand:- start:209 stop:514 length:306 start_codon:yes stop_codon:yes gene_type:complete